MKNHIVLTVALMLCLCHLQAQPETNVTASLEAKFAQEFSTAKDIRWDRADRVTFAQFEYQDQFWVAYYEVGSEQLIATARKISEPGYLPLLVRQSMEEFRQHRGTGMKIGPVYELIQDGTARYLVTLDGGQWTYTITFDSMGGRSIVDKNRKGDTRAKSDQDELIARRIRR